MKRATPAQQDLRLFGGAFVFCKTEMKIFSLYIFLLIEGFLGAIKATSSSKVNILFLMADQMRSDTMGCAGNKVAITPNLDKLASEGVRFKNAFSTTPTCTPARSAILTGLSPWYHGMLAYGSIAKRYPYEMPRALSASGYYTYSIGKDHFGWDKAVDAGVPHGYNGTKIYDGIDKSAENDDYDQWFEKELPGIDPMITGLTFNDYRGKAYALPEYFHPTAWVGRSAVQYLSEYNRTEPFFLKVSFHRPHSPYDPPQRWIDRYTLEDMPSPYQGGNWDSRYAVHYNTTPDPGIWCGDLGLQQERISRQAYYASISFVDEWIGEVLQVLELRGLSNNTVVLFTADHGDMMGDHYHWRKSYPYHGSAHIPMIMKVPQSMESSHSLSFSAASVIDEVAELRDLFPTFLDIAGVDTPSGIVLNGSSLLNLLRPSSLTKTKWREYIDLEHGICYNVTNHWNGLSDGHMKYIFEAYFPDEQLFNLDEDPGELTNLAGDPKWQTELMKWRQKLITQFEAEGRGEEWVKDGKLMQRVKGQLYSPNYPSDTYN